MSASDLTSQLSALSDSLKTTTTLINRLARLQFQPGSEPLDGEGGVRVELAQDIHDSLKHLEEELEFLRQEAEDLTENGGNRRRRTILHTEDARLSAKVARLAEELIHSRQQFRNAQISAKLASDEAKRKEREAVLESYRKEADQLVAAEDGGNGSAGGERERLFAQRGKKEKLQRQLNKDEVLVNASSDVTAALRRTHDLLSTELSRSRFAQETFDESTTALAQLGEDYSNLDSILSNSRNLLGTLLRSQKSDTWYLETAFYILIATLSWLIFRRILYGPFFKLPIFLWRIVALLANWTILRPLYFFLWATGVITSEPATSPLRAASRSTSTSRPPLIIQPSATRRSQSFSPEDRASFPQAGVPAGAGGANAKAGKDPILAGQISEQIGRMAEESAKQNSNNQQQTPEEKGQEAKEKELPRRGDGTVLQERGDIPKNPKKKAFEADVEGEATQQRRKRDEL